MNFSDSEIVASILSEQGYNTTLNQEEADLILLNTCSIRESWANSENASVSVQKFKAKQNPISQLAYWAAWPKDWKQSSWKKSNWLT